MKKHAKCSTGDEYRAVTDILQVQIQTISSILSTLKRVQNAREPSGMFMLPEVTVAIYRD